MVEFMMNIDRENGNIQTSYIVPMIIEGNNFFGGIQIDTREELLSCIEDMSLLQDFYQSFEDEPEDVFDYLEQEILLAVHDYEDGSFYEEYSLADFNSLIDFLKSVDEFIMNMINDN